MKDNSRKYGIIIGALLITIALMTIGYAALAAKLTINGAKKPRWSINTTSLIKDETLSTSGANEIAKPKISGTSFTFNVNFTQPGEKIVYNVTVKNEGTIDAIYEETTGLNETNNTSSNIIYTIERLDNNSQTTTGKADLLSGKTNNFRITIEWSNDNSTAQTINTETTVGTLNLIYDQK